MQHPTEITFHGIEHSDAVEMAIQRWVARLEQIHARLTKCGVVVSQPHRRHRHGSQFQVSLVLEVPGLTDVISVTHVMHEDIYVAIADAFRAARRQLKARVERRQGFVKTHVPERTGHVGLNVDKQRGTGS